MTKIFLSYAEEDQIVGRGLARALVDRGFTVYWWQDPSRPGGRFQDDIEQEIYAAGRFVAVLSDSYLRSPWCRRERNMAVQLEVVEERKGFIAVFEAGAVRQEWLGWLGEYARIPVRGTDWNATVDDYVTAIGGQASHAAAPAMSTGPRPKFRNRVDELNLIVDELTIEGGIDVWLISAPPQLGKSWFLDELADRVRRQVPDCQVRMLDVKAERSVLRSDPVMLLKTMLDISSPLPGVVEKLRGPDLNRVATELSRRRRPQLYLLDSAELLEGRTPEWLRRSLDEVLERLSGAVTRPRVRVIISGRQVDKWPLMSRVRSRKLRLTEFTEGIVRAALTDMAGQNHNLGTERFDALTRRLHRFCEGLPALLVEMLDRVEDHDFIGIDDDEWWQEAFTQLIRPYVADQLLSTDSLFPAGGTDLGQSKALIELGLRALVPYRMVTRSHLVFHINRDDEMRAALDELSWGPSSLLKALHETALVVPVPGKPWHEISPPIRQLLYRYYLTDAQNRETVQRAAQQYYQSFCEKLAGTEQPVRLVQYIWHEVERRSAGMATKRLDDLPEFAAEATKEFICDSIYSTSELDQFTSQLLEDDLELRHALSTQVGLFEAVRGSIQSVIEGMADD